MTNFILVNSHLIYQNFILSAYFVLEELEEELSFLSNAGNLNEDVKLNLTTIWLQYAK